MPDRTLTGKTQLLDDTQTNRNGFIKDVIANQKYASVIG